VAPEVERRLPAPGLRHQRKEHTMNASEVVHAGGDMSRSVIDAAAGVAAKAQEGARAAADELGSHLPGIASAGAEGAVGSVKMLQEFSDPRLQLLVAFSLGIGAGLWMAGAPRLVTLAALSPALVAGVAIASRKQGRSGRGAGR
jgi:hypothetical protein